MDSCSVLSKFAMDVEVLGIGNRDVILGLSWLTGKWIFSGYSGHVPEER